jgi:hypothetical protein
MSVKANSQGSETTGLVKCESLLIQPEFEALRNYYGDLTEGEEQKMWSNLSGFFSILHEWQTQSEVITPEIKEAMHDDAA